MLAIEILSEAIMKIHLNAYQSTLLDVNATMREYVDSWLRVKDDASVTFANVRAGYEMLEVGDLPGWADMDDHQVGDSGSVHVLHRGGGPDPADRDAPDLSGDAIFQGGSIGCPGGGSLTCLPLQNLTREDPSLLIDPDTGAPYSDQYGDQKPRLVDRKNGKRRPFDVKDPTDGKFRIWSPPYVYGENGAALLRMNPNAGHHNAADPYDCDNLDTTSNSDDPTAKYVTEHGLELQYLPRLLEFLWKGPTEIRTALSIAVIEPWYLQWFFVPAALSR